MAETKRGIDVEKMKAAMDRAAEKAMHGTREERSRRFALSDDARSTAERQKQPLYAKQT